MWADTNASHYNIETSSIMIIPKDILQVCDNYNTEALLSIKWEEFPELIGLITSTDFNTGH